MFGINFYSHDEEEMNVTSRYNKKARKGQEPQGGGPFKALTCRGRTLQEEKKDDSLYESGVDYAEEFEHWVDEKTMDLTGCADDNENNRRHKMPWSRKGKQQKQQDESILALPELSIFDYNEPSQSKKKKTKSKKQKEKSQQDQDSESMLELPELSIFHYDETTQTNKSASKSKKQKSKSQQDQGPDSLLVLPALSIFDSEQPSSSNKKQMKKKGMKTQQHDDPSFLSQFNIFDYNNKDDSQESKKKINKKKKKQNDVPQETSSLFSIFGDDANETTAKTERRKQAPTSSPFSLFRGSSSPSSSSSSHSVLEEELYQAKKLLRNERAEKRELQKQLLDSVERKHKNGDNSKYHERLKRLQSEIEVCQRELSRERNRRKQMKEELEQAQKETQHCQERLRCVMFQHIPQVSPRFKDMGPIDQLIKEEIVTKEEGKSDDVIKKGSRVPFANYKSVGNFQFGKVLGEGHYGKVQEAMDVQRGYSYAIKILSKQRVKNFKDFTQISTEIHVLKNCQHPNIIQLHDVIHSPTSIYLVMELCEMDIHKYHSDFGFNEKCAKHVLLGILRPLSFLHSQGICHLDLKPENLLLTRGFRTHDIHYSDVRLCDFGLVHTSKSDSGDVYRKGYACGTPGFYAPEMILQKEFEGRIADMWSLGCILLEITLGFTQEWLDAYEHVGKKDKDKKADGAVDGDDNNVEVNESDKFRKGLEDCLAEISREAYYPHHQQLLDLIHRCLAINPINRTPSRRAIKHPWLQPILNEIAGDEKREDMTLSPQYSHCSGMTDTTTTSTNTRTEDDLTMALDGTVLDDDEVMETIMC